jgi:nucleoside-diphosphate-sugar epimerase
MRILIVGGAGYVGGAVVDLLEKSGHDIRVYDSLVYEEDYRRDVPFVFGDVRDTDKLIKHLAWADCVIWLAALVGDAACALDPKASKEVNQDSVEYLASNFNGRIIYPSTCSVYGAQHNVMLDENSPAKPLSVYAETKLGAEQYLAGKNAIIFRLGTLFGVSDLFSRIRFDLVVNYMTLKAHRDKTISVYGGEQYRPLLHVKDVARTIVENIQSRNTGIFNLCKQNVKIANLACQVQNHFPNLQIERTELSFEDSRNYMVSNRKAVEGLGFNPIHSIDEGIEDIKYLLDNYRLRSLDNLRYSNGEFLSKLRGEK